MHVLCILAPKSSSWYHGTITQDTEYILNKAAPFWDLHLYR